MWVCGFGHTLTCEGSTPVEFSHVGFPHEHESHAHTCRRPKLIHDKIELIRETATDTPHVDTLQDTIADSYENAASYHASATLSSLIGTNMHVEAEIDDLESYTLADMVGLTNAELDSLRERDTHNWLTLS